MAAAAAPAAAETEEKPTVKEVDEEEEKEKQNAAEPCGHRGIAALDGEETGRHHPGDGGTALTAAPRIPWPAAPPAAVPAATADTAAMTRRSA
eukprot:4142864-Lingulodinium_polyedra.AAC.1